MPQTFTPKTWADGASGGTPIVAAELNRIENGVESMDQRGAALELGILTPVTVTYAASITLDATTGALFRITATGDLTIAGITGATDGQLVAIQVLASGASRNVSFSIGGASTVTVASGSWNTWGFRYNSSGTTWVLVYAPVTSTTYSDEQAQDAAAALFTSGSHAGISFTYNDASNTINATTSGYVPLTTIDAKGDLLVGTANDVVTRQGIGSNGTLLASDSTQTNGIGWQANPTPAPVTLTDGVTVSLDASLGKVFKLNAAGDRTINNPTNAVGGRGIIIVHTASGAPRTLTLSTGSSGAFIFGSDITGLTATATGLTDYIGAIYDAVALRWRVISYVKGYP